MIVRRGALSCPALCKIPSAPKGPDARINKEQVLCQAPTVWRLFVSAPRTGPRPDPFAPIIGAAGFYPGLVARVACATNRTAFVELCRQRDIHDTRHPLRGRGTAPLFATVVLGTAFAEGLSIKCAAL